MLLMPPTTNSKRGNALCPGVKEILIEFVLEKAYNEKEGSLLDLLLTIPIFFDFYAGNAIMFVYWIECNFSA